jgi:hypothetical protein
MSNPTRIAACGDSLLLTLVADSLAGHAGFRVIRVAPRWPGALAQCTAPAWLADCDVALVERDGDCETDHFILALLQARPDLPVIGLDASHSVLTVLSSRQQAAATVDDLTGLIEGIVGNTVTKEGE